jgi:thiol-disulfide isomerase/thioredoxin
MSGLRLACLLLFCLAPGLASAADSPYQTDAPVSFELERLGGGSLNVSRFRGQWVVLNYWATWCAPCRKEIPELMALHAERDDVTVLGLAFEENDSGNFETFLEEFHPNYPILLVDVYHPPQPFGAPKVLPTTIVLDPRGYAVHGFAGPVTGAMLEAFIDDGTLP